MIHLVATPPYAARMGTTMGVLHTTEVWSRIATEKICEGKDGSIVDTRRPVTS